MKSEQAVLSNPCLEEEEEEEEERLKKFIIMNIVRLGHYGLFLGVTRGDMPLLNSLLPKL
jgi:hypothetical protein